MFSSDFTGTGERADRAAAETVDPDPAGLAADFEFVLELGVFDAAADVGEGEFDLVVFQDDEFPPRSAAVAARR